ncbi:MAG: hypothetical protein IPJ64_08265 [Saprospiraceae bacterium]|nr:hypothetical protein [Saprospiraceae bacterium]MBK7796344.1 hypothetical protein [Saprospiraceae bacterium]
MIKAYCLSASLWTREQNIHILSSHQVWMQNANIAIDHMVSDFQMMNPVPEIERTGL